MKVIWKIICAMLAIFAVGCGSDISSDSSSASVAEDKIKGIVWSLKSVTIEGVNIPIKGNAYLEFKTDGTSVYHEAYLSLPKIDYGPCWYVSKETTTVSETSMTYKTIEEHGRDACKRDDASESTDTLSVTDTAITITQPEDGYTVISTYEKDASIKSLDYTALVEAVNGKTPITVNTSADSYIEDENENDNLTLLLTECDLDWNGTAKITQYFKSEALSQNRIIEMDYYAPSLSSWVEGKYTNADSSDSCGAPGFRDYVAKDVQEAKTSRISGDTLYACGGTCKYTLIDETHDENNKYTSLSLSWECTNVGVNPLSSPTVFDNVIDKHLGKAICTKN